MTQTGYIAPEGEVSVDTVGIIATIIILNGVSWQVTDMGPEYTKICKHLVARQDTLKNYASLIQNPERELILSAID